MPHRCNVLHGLTVTLLFTFLGVAATLSIATAENPSEPAAPIQTSISDSAPVAPEALSEEPDTLVEEEEEADGPQTADTSEPAPESLEAGLLPATEPSTEVPPAEELLQLTPLSRSTARFSDLLTPPAEATEDVVGQLEPGHQDIVYNVPIVLDPSVQGHIHYFNT